MAKSSRPAVRVRVLDPQERVLPNAIVTAVPQGGGTAMTLSPDGEWRCYASPLLHPGSYTLSASEAGLESQTRTVELGENATETFVLAPPGTPFYYRGHVKVPFDLPHTIAVALEYGQETAIDSIRSIPQHAGLGASPFPEIDMGSYVRRQRVHVFRIPGGSHDIGRQFERLVRANPAVRAVGTAVRLGRTSISFLTDQIVVKLRPGAALPPSLSGHGLHELRRLAYVENGYVITGSGAATIDLLQICNGLAADSAVLWAEPNMFSTVVAHSNDPLFGVQPHHTLINSPGAWSRANGKGQSSRIAVVDVDGSPAHEDLAANVVATFNFDAMTQSLDAGIGHGTASAGIAAARINNNKGVAGVAGLADLVCVQINAETHVQFADVFLWCAGLNAQSTNPAFPPPLAPGADVISNSWGIEGLAAGGLSTTPGMGGGMTEAFDTIESEGRSNKGCVIVFAAGNENADVAVMSPWAAYPTNVAVGSSSTTIPEQRYPNSNFGADLDVCAPGGGPGSGLTATTDTSAAKYGTFGQTSCACPQVAGAAAIMISIKSSLTASAVRAKLRNTAVKIDHANTDPIGAYDANNFSEWYGEGRIDVARSAQAARNTN